jgi:hypothetical protein
VEVIMTGLERLAMLYYLLAALSLLLGILLGHAITLRSWVSWWGDVAPFLQERIRRIVREELQRERAQRSNRDPEK